MATIAQRPVESWDEAGPFRWLTDFDYARLLHAPGRSPGIPVVESFDWSGQPLEPGYRRIRVMARQTYVLCHAAIGGNRQAASLAPIAARSLMRHGIGGDGQFLCRLTPEGGALDASADLYDIAFGLFAMAWWHRLSGDADAVAAAATSVARLQHALAAPAGEGFLARAGDIGPFQQNPHMHLFEAACFLAAFTGELVFRALADQLFELVESRLFDAATGTLPELFDAEWRPLREADGVRIEPGHHYEWVWLLHRYGRLAGQERAFAIADRLFAFALTHGHDPATGLIYDAVDQRGRPIATDLRVWPNTELLKAQIAMQERHGCGPGFNDFAIAANVRRIRDHFLTPPPDGPAAALGEGWWIDYLTGGDLRPKASHIPASSLYHIFFAFAELLRHRAGRDPFSGMPW